MAKMSSIQEKCPHAPLQLEATLKTINEVVYMVDGWSLKGIKFESCPLLRPSHEQEVPVVRKEKKNIVGEKQYIYANKKIVK